MPKPKLTEKQERFVREYLVDFNGTRAAIRAGCPERSARQMASKWLTKDHIRSRLRELSRKRNERVEKRGERVVEELRNLAMRRVSDAFNDEGKLKPINDWPDELRAALSSFEVVDVFEDEEQKTGRRSVLVKAHFEKKLPAVRLLGQHEGIFKDADPLEGLFDVAKALKEARERAANRPAP